MGLGSQPQRSGLNSPSPLLSLCPRRGAGSRPPAGSGLQEAMAADLPQRVPRSREHTAGRVSWQRCTCSSLAPSGQRGVAAWVSGCCKAAVGPRRGELDRGQWWEERVWAPRPHWGSAGKLPDAPSLVGRRELRLAQNRRSAWHPLVTEQWSCVSLHYISRSHWG